MLVEGEHKPVSTHVAVGRPLQGQLDVITASPRPACMPQQEAPWGKLRISHRMHL